LPNAVRVLAINPYPTFDSTEPVEPTNNLDDDRVTVPMGPDLCGVFFMTTGAYRDGGWYIEGLLPGEVTLQLSITKNGCTCSDKVKLTVIRVDLDGDANHNGVVGPADDPEDALEDTLPGVITLCNVDDDDENGMEDSRVALRADDRSRSFAVSSELPR
jgi:hypothetical protein